MGLSKDLFGDTLEVSRPYWGPRGACWSTLGAVLGGLGALVELFGEVRGVYWGHLEGHLSKKGGVLFLRPPVGARKVGSWCPLGPLFGRS